ncbi:hypothetical protein TcG_08461 [Trypanosoma cruzi]|nr:hypothetical protein TcG_08461 [Trypanosoma cruzi]
MSFAGLQKRLKNKAVAPTTANSTPPSSDAKTDTIESSSSVYDVAAREARANHEERKRQRSPHDKENTAYNPTINERNGPADMPSDLPSVEKASSKNLTETEFLERRHLAEEVVLQCAEAMSRNMELAAASIDKIDIKKESVVYEMSGLPLPLCQFLEQRLQRSSDATAMLISTCEEEEHNLISALRSPSNLPMSFPPQVEDFVTTLRTLWLALCWHWVVALRGKEGKEVSENGWSYNVYLLSRHALPITVRNTRGRDVALALQEWQEAYRVRQNMLDFLAYILHDMGVVLRFSGDDASKGDENLRIVPPKIADSIFCMVQHLRRRDFTAVRQAYVELTMGTANWKLGLFSGGEVHMRRSMERIERRRIEHLLHNERAVRLLHVLRELIEFVQKNEVMLLHTGIFAREKSMKEHSS